MRAGFLPWPIQIFKFGGKTGGNEKERLPRNHTSRSVRGKKGTRCAKPSPKLRSVKFGGRRRAELNPRPRRKFIRLSGNRANGWSNASPSTSRCSVGGHEGGSGWFQPSPICRYVSVCGKLRGALNVGHVKTNFVNPCGRLKFVCASCASMRSTTASCSRVNES